MAVAVVDAKKIIIFLTDKSVNYYLFLKRIKKGIDGEPKVVIPNGR